MSIQHAMNILGAVQKIQGWKLLWLLRRGQTVTRIDWRGSMAEKRWVDKIGKIVRREKKKLNDGCAYVGIVVRYGTADEWEPLDNVRFVGPKHEVEVW